MTEPTAQDLARQLYDAFETRHRGEHKDEPFVCLKDDAPEWMSDAVREAHGVEMFPDDRRYELIQNAAEAIANVADGDEFDNHEFADAMVDPYTWDRLRWLASHLGRVELCDRAREDFMIPEDADVADRIASGQYLEAAEVYDRLALALLNAAADGSTHPE